MDAGSPASSSTEPGPEHGAPRLTDETGATSEAPTTDTPPPADPTTAALPPAVPRTAEGADLARRRFFRDFAGEIVQSAATVMGAAQALQRASTAAASAILDPGSLAEVPPPVTRLADAPPPPPTGFRTPFREDGDTLYLI